MIQKPNLEQFNLTEDEITNIISEVNTDDNETPNECEERSSLFKMTEQSRNLLNSSEDKDELMSNEIDFDNLLSFGLKSNEEINKSASNSNNVVDSSISQMSSGVINDCMNDNKDPELNINCSLKFESQIEEQTEIEEQFVETENLENIIKDDQDLQIEKEVNTNNSNTDNVDNNNPDSNLKEEKEFSDIHKEQSMIKLKKKNSDEKKIECESNTSKQL